MTPKQGATIWCGLLFLDSWALTWPLVEARPEAPLYEASSCVQQIRNLPPGEGRILDRNDGARGRSPLGYGSPLAFQLELESLRGYNPLDLLRYKEYLQFIAADDWPLQAFSNPLTVPVIGDFPIRNKRLLDLLGVRYLLQPRISQARRTRRSGEPLADDAAPGRLRYLVAGGVRPLPLRTTSIETRRRCHAPSSSSARAACRRPVDVLSRLSSTDFTQEVLLETGEPTD